MDPRELMEFVGPNGVVTDPDLIASAVRDWTGRWVGSSPALVLPRSTNEVVAVVNWCRDRAICIVPQGGNTGMVGGSVPLNDEIVVSLTKMTDISVDALAGTLTAQAGATLAAVQAAAAGAGWAYGVDLGARDTATMGGTVATNAGGLRVLRYGDTRHQLLGIQAVTGAGEVVGDLRGLVKDNTGYHLPSLLAGSEGTLAVVTAACVRLHTAVAETAVALIGFPTEASALEAIRTVRGAVNDLSALEIFFADGLDLVCTQFDLPHPLATNHHGYLLVEAAGPEGTTDGFARALSRIGVPGSSVAVGQTKPQQDRLWRYREAHTEAIALLGPGHKLDITVPQTAMADFVTRVRACVGAVAPNATTWLFGHAGDGNLHVNVTGVDPRTAGIDEAVLNLAVDHGGSISAEHGIGRAKAPYLHLNRTEQELALARRLKAAFDPSTILNPGVLLTS